MILLPRNKHAMQNGSTSHFLLLALAAFIVGIGLYGLQNAQRESSSLENLQKAVSLLESPRTLPEFTMTNHLGSKFTNQDLNGSWSFVFFGFTHCPDVCPLTLNTMNQASNLLSEDIQKQVVFISVDPNRDQPEKLKDYVTHFNNDTIGLTGNKEQIDQLTKSLGAIYAIPENKSENYLVDHSAHIFVIAPNGKLTALFSTPHDANVIADDFKIINSAYNSKYKS